MMEAHPLAELIPSMSADEYRDLRDDVAANGLREPVTIFDGRLLDGRHRARACEETETELLTREYTGDDPARFVVSVNVHRRHLSTTQRAQIALAVLPHYKELAKQRQHEGQRRGAQTLPGQKTQKTPSRHHRARDAAAADVGVSGITVARLERVARSAPDLYAQVQSGEMTTSAAWQEVRKRDEPTPAQPPNNGDSPMSRKARMNADAAGRRISKVCSSLDGWAMGLADFDVNRALQTAEPAQVEEWINSISHGISALRQLRTDLQEDHDS